MSKRTVRVLFGVFLVVNLLVITYPAAVPFNRVEPLVLGLPFNLFWVALWVALGGLALLLLHLSERRGEG